MEDEQADCVELAVQRHERGLMAYAYSLLHRIADAQDVVQEAFLALAKAKCAEIPNREAWLVTRCRWECGRIFRARRRTDDPNFPWETLSDDNVVLGADAVQQAEKHAELLKHLELIPEKQREVVRLRYIAGMKVEEIAVALGMERNNVSQLLFQGLKSLRKLLGGKF